MAAFQPRTDKTYLPKKKILDSQLNSSSWLRSEFSTRASGKISPIYAKWMKASQEKIRYSKDADLNGNGYHGNIWKEFYVDQETLDNDDLLDNEDSYNTTSPKGKHRDITDLIAQLYPIKLPYVAWVGENNISHYERQIAKKQKNTIASNNNDRYQRIDYKLLKFQTDGRMPPINSQGRVISYSIPYKSTQGKKRVSYHLNNNQRKDEIRQADKAANSVLGLQISNLPLSARVSSKPLMNSSLKKKKSNQRSAGTSRESNIIITLNDNQQIEE
ncbi:uncharacterized protein TRIADDRAFT_61650 [Trichoplax adhaerens]|uniref:Uncharacterized protein n=1 Tax=Trichoplax adhaerens TaxID=10228 RepID=B3SBK7_TRIAD|nr:predicted protein [Trichoplax adhaerens]EDV19905.1 predicted protein [Trichoplax adhaerens]|eukprot:XP_002117647.1 predicted protein [Trichoplax adhaerens]